MPTVRIEGRAELELQEAFDYILEQSGDDPALRWRKALQQLLLLIAEQPGTGSLVHVAGREEPYRQVLHHSHRVVYRFDEATDTLWVVRILHRARNESP